MNPLQAPLFPAVGQRLIQLDNDELVVIRFARTRVAADAKGKIIIVENTDVFVIEDDDIFDGVEWKCEMKSRAHVASQHGSESRCGSLIFMRSTKPMKNLTRFNIFVPPVENDFVKRIETTAKILTRDDGG